MSFKGLAKEKMPQALEAGMTKIEHKAVFSGKMLAKGGLEVMVREASTKPRKPAIYTKVEAVCKVKTNRDLSQWDRAVHDAVATLYAAGNSWTTAGMVYKIMTGKDRKPVPEVEEAIRKSVELMGETTVTIDAEAEAEMRGKPSCARFEGRLLAVDKVTTDGGVVYYRMLRQSPLYDYTVMTGQIERPALKALAAPLDGSVATTRLQTMMLHEVLIRKRKPVLRRDPIPTERIYEATGADTKRRRQEARHKVRQLLDAWTVSGLVGEWSEAVKNGTVTGYMVGFTAKPGTL